MRFVIQRVQHAEVKVNGETTGSIGKGFLVLIGVAETDTREIADKMIKKLLGLRIFEDAEGKTNLDLDAVDGELLLVSQFTLYADCKKGNRPSFIKAGNPDMVYKFCSTSKVTFPGSGIAALGTSEKNLEYIKSVITIQTIGHDKLNQLRHVRYFKNIDGMKEHMRKHAAIIRPKFEYLIGALDKELGGLEIGEWTRPIGGYFVSFDSLDGCAKEIVAKCKEAGVVLTGAGSAYPYKKDPDDRNIRLAPTFPPLEDLKKAAEVFILCVKLVSVNKLLSDKEA